MYITPSSYRHHMETIRGVPLTRTVSRLVMIGRARNTCSSSFVIGGGAGLEAEGAGLLSAAPAICQSPLVPATTRHKVVNPSIICLFITESLQSLSVRVDSLAARMPDLNS